VSPHITIDQTLEALEHPGSRDIDDNLADGLLIRLFTASEITIEEFHHYSARLLKISRKRKELS
jgi:hypothetical protein